MPGSPIALTYRTNDNTRWGTGQGSNLGSAEIDQNFWNLAEAIAGLETASSLPNGIASITVVGTQMSITLTSGTVLGPFTLPVLMFNWRGAWEPGTNYAPLDTFIVAGVGIFTVMEPYFSPVTFNPTQVGTDGNPVLNQLFGATGNSLETLSDVLISNIQNGQTIEWNATAGQWQNVGPLGTMSLQNATAVAITGGTVTGLPTPTNPADAATKAYVDAAGLGAASVADGDVIANITGAPHSPTGVTVSALLDHVFGTTTVGTVMYRGGSGWTALAPGTSGQFLKTLGAGIAPAWASGGSGVTDLAAGTGISTGGSDITSTGTVSLAAIATATLLANISGSSAAPSSTTLTALIDNALGNTRGAVLYRGASGWVLLAPGTSGKYLQTSGPGADPIWNSPAGAGTVTDIAAGTGISTGGSDITSTGTISLAAIADGDVLANTSGSSAAPVPTTLSALIDHIFSAAQGDILYRGASSWGVLAPGTNGQVLTTGGSAANPSWANAPSGGSIANLDILANISGSTAAPIGNTLSAVLDAVLGSSQGDIIYRSASAWTVLAPGQAGQALISGGAAANVAWASVASPKFHVVTLATAGAALPANSYTHGGGAADIGATLTMAANGDVTIDGVAVSSLGGGGSNPLGYRLLIKDEAAAAHNGIYTVTQIGTASVPMILTRATDANDTTVFGGGDVVFVGSGAANDASIWVGQVAAVPFTLGTTGLTFAHVAGGTASGTKYAIACYVPGVLTNSQNLLFHKFSKGATFPANFTATPAGHASEAGGSTNATGSTVINVSKATAAAPNTFSTVGTITIGASSVTATFASTGGTSVAFAQGDVLRLQGPSSADATFADFYATLAGFES